MKKIACIIFLPSLFRQPNIIKLLSKRYDKTRVKISIFDFENSFHKQHVYVCTSRCNHDKLKHFHIYFYHKYGSAEHWVAKRLACWHVSRHSPVLYHLQVYFTKVKLNLTWLKVNFTNIKIIFTNMNLNITLVKIYFTMYRWNLRNWKSILQFLISILFTCKWFLHGWKGNLSLLRWILYQ